MPNISEAFPFAPTRYFGSKRRQIDWIAPILLSLNPRAALDPMGGTGTVTHALSILGINTTYCDSFSFNVEAARGLFNKAEPNIEDLILKIRQIKPINGFISKNFKNIFFTDKENAWLDGLMASLPSFSKNDSQVLFYSLTQACLKKRPYNLFHRANLYMRHATVPRSFGNSTTWEKSFISHMSEAFDVFNTVKKSTLGDIKIVSARDILKHADIYDLIYIDPPYFNKNKVETYAQRYHFLEGLCSYKNWHNIIDLNSAIKKIKKEYLPPEWVSAQQLLTGISNVAIKHSTATLAISYIDQAVPSIAAIVTELKKYRKSVCIHEKECRTALSKNTRREILIIATNGA